MILILVIKWLLQTKKSTGLKKVFEAKAGDNLANYDRKRFCENRYTYNESKDQLIYLNMDKVVKKE